MELRATTLALVFPLLFLGSCGEPVEGAIQPDGPPPRDRGLRLLLGAAYVHLLENADDLRVMKVEPISEGAWRTAGPAALDRRLGRARVVSSSARLSRDRREAVVNALLDPATYRWAATPPRATRAPAFHLLVRAGEGALAVGCNLTERLVSFEAGGAGQRVLLGLSRRGLDVLSALATEPAEAPR